MILGWKIDIFFMDCVEFVWGFGMRFLSCSFLKIYNELLVCLNVEDLYVLLYGMWKGLIIYCINFGFRYCLNMWGMFLNIIFLIF